ncbi:MAG: fumarate hydratase [Oscillospiraceae bacterium]|nr:fumarate hydratase [Oscillospiraceae bacterium]
MARNLRFIETEQITQAVAELCVKANVCIGGDIRAALSKAQLRETSPLAGAVLALLSENAEIAERENLPVCQDTGMSVVFVWLGSDVHVNGDISVAINEGVRRGYRDGYCRNSVVRDPIDRINTGDNTPAVIHYDFTEGDFLRITVMPKGFGSENMSAVKMLKPSDGLSGAADFIVETVRLAEANPCPPIIAGVGIGGTLEKAALLSKQALLRDLGEINPQPLWADFEAGVLERINNLGIGAAGFGGRTTALGVNVLTYPTHIAGLPIAVNIGCHATRHRTIIL